MTAGEQRELGAQRQITPAMRESWARHDQQMKRRVRIVRLIMLGWFAAMLAWAVSVL